MAAKTAKVIKAVNPLSLNALPFRPNEALIQPERGGRSALTATPFGLDCIEVRHRHLPMHSKILLRRGRNNRIYL